jgi:hypothetical protein
MVTAIVQFQLPHPVSPEAAREIFAGAAPEYRRVPGLLRKDFLLGEDRTAMGGIYRWQSREAAEAFYQGVLRGYLRERFGVEPQITFFHTPVVVDNVRGETLLQPELPSTLP